MLEDDPSPTYFELPAFCWWMLLEKLPAVEELEIDANLVKALYAAWEKVGAPAVLPALHQIHVVSVANTATTTVEQGPFVSSPIRKRFISRTVPSKVVKKPNLNLPAPVPAVVSVPSTIAPDDVLPSSAQFPDEKSLDRLIKLLQGGSGRLDMV